GAATPNGSNGMLVLRLAYRPPFAWEETIAFLASRATPGVEAVVDGAYLRLVRHDGTSGIVTVEHDLARTGVRLSIPAVLSPALAQILASARRLFDLSADPLSIARTLGT